MSSNTVIYATSYISSKYITSTIIEPFIYDDYIKINDLYIIDKDDVSSIPPNSSYIKISPKPVFLKFTLIKYYQLPVIQLQLMMLL